MEETKEEAPPVEWKERVPDEHKVCVKGYPTDTEDALKAFFVENVGPITDFYSKPGPKPKKTAAAAADNDNNNNGAANPESAVKLTNNGETEKLGKETAEPKSAVDIIADTPGGPFCYIGFQNLATQAKALELDGTQFPVPSADTAGSDGTIPTTVMIAVRPKQGYKRPEKKLAEKKANPGEGPPRGDAPPCRKWRFDGSACDCGRDCHKQPERSDTVLALEKEHGVEHFPPAWQREEIIFDHPTDPFQWRALMVDLFALGVNLDNAANKRNGNTGGALCELMAKEAAESKQRTQPMSAEELTAARLQKDKDGEHVLATLHEVFDHRTLPQRSNRDPFHVAYSRILRSTEDVLPQTKKEWAVYVRTGNTTEAGAREDQEAAAAAKASVFQKYAEEIVQVRTRFESTLHKYIREVCAPMLGVGPDDLVYQRSPTLRVGFPIIPGVLDKAMGRPHNDYEYFHQPAEVNFWMPLTNVWGANSLQTESAPGRKDFHALELGYGQCTRFWGNQVWHYCVPNTTDKTRVSLDFRVIVKSRFNEKFRDVNNNVARFKVGEFYRDSAEEGE